MNDELNMWMSRWDQYRQLYNTENVASKKKTRDDNLIGLIIGMVICTLIGIFLVGSCIRGEWFDVESYMTPYGTQYGVHGGLWWLSIAILIVPVTVMATVGINKNNKHVQESINKLNEKWTSLELYKFIESYPELVKEGYVKLS